MDSGPEADQKLFDWFYSKYITESKSLETFSIIGWSNFMPVEPNLQIFELVLCISFPLKLFKSIIFYKNMSPQWIGRKKKKKLILEKYHRQLKSLYPACHCPGKTDKSNLNAELFIVREAGSCRGSQRNSLPKICLPFS